MIARAAGASSISILDDATRLGAAARGRLDSIELGRLFARIDVPNPGGQVRTVEEAMDLARRHGLGTKDELAMLDIRVMGDRPRLGPGQRLDATWGPQSISSGQRVTWEMLENEEGGITVLLNPDVLTSDLRIISTLAHELHEIRGMLARLGGGRSMSGAEFCGWSAREALSTKEHG